MQELKLPRFESFDELLDQNIGYYDNIFFGNNSDWSKILLFFNGAITKKKVERDLDSAIFQRWSWYEKFRHPIFCIADPMTYGENGIPLAWYQGQTDELYLENIISKIKLAVTKKTGTFESIAFGSSGGGFAALLTAQLGLADSVIAINPQTDILKFSEENAVKAFLNCRKDRGVDGSDEAYSLLNVGFSLMKPHCNITYLQNTHDENHYNEHMIPYITSLLNSGVPHLLNLCCFSNQTLGHNPPTLQMISEIAGPAFKKLLK